MNRFEEMNEIFKFAQIVNRMKLQNTADIELSNEEKAILIRVKEKYSANSKYLDLLEKILRSNKDNEIQVIYDFYEQQEKKQQQEQKQQDEKNPEEEIAQVFGISASQIKHLYLNNGKEVFFFYSEELGKDILLENNKRGKSITEVLQEIQDGNKKYQSEDEVGNANDIMMDTRLKTNLELDMYVPEEVLQHTSEIEKLNDNDKILLGHLLSNKEKLDIKLINIENLVYVTNSHEIKEIKFDIDFKPVTDSPTENDSSSTKDVETDDDNSYRDTSFDDAWDSEEDEDENKDDKSLEDANAKKMVLYRQNDKGYIGYIGLIVTLTTVGFLIMLLIQSL